MDSYCTGKGYGQSRQNTSFSMSRSMRSIAQHELGDRTSRCSAVELDGKLRNTQRRRVPLACARCRKRKIKCSGDAGDGQSCTNCRSAGNTDCQFLRMNSWNPPCWPYPSPATGMARSPRPARAYPQASGKLTLLAIGSSQPGPAGLQRGPDYDIASANVHGYSRLAGMGMGSVHYEVEQSVPCNQSSAYILPSAPAGAIVEYAGSPWSPKVWDSVLAVSRPPNTGIYEQTTSLNQSPFACMLTGHALGSNEIPQSTTATMSAIPSPDADRTLPVPTIQSQQLPTSTPSLNIIPSEGDSNMAFKDSYWSARCGTSPNQQTTTTATVPSNGSFSSGSPSPMTMKCSTADTSTSDMLFNYLPVPATTDDMTPGLSSSAGSAPSTTTSADTSFTCLESLDPSSDYKSIPNDNRPSRNYSRGQNSMGDRLVTLANGCTSDIYGYSGSEKKSRAADDDDHRCSAATLMNGLPYQRVRHADTPNPALSLNFFPDTISEYHHNMVENVQRPPVSPLGNQNGY